MADLSYQPKVYRKQGGEEFVVASGGKINIETGGDIEVNGVSLIDEVAALSGLEAGEVAYLDGVTAGTVTAGKAVVTTTSKHIDALVISDGGLALGAGAGTAITSTAAELNILDGATLAVAELNILDGVTSTAAELNILDGVTATAAEINLIDGSIAGTAVASKALALGADKNVDVLAVADGGLALGAGAGTAITSTAAELNILDGVTSTAAELNALDGITSDVNELNILDGVTSTAAELNILDGVTATAAELNALDGITADVGELNILDGVTSTAAELNILDGVTSTAAEINSLDDSAAFADGLSRVRLATATYDFAVNGGAISAIPLAATVPDNAVILDGMVDVVTTLTSATDAATIALSVEGADDIVTAVAILTATDWDAGLRPIKPLGTSATAIKTTAARAITATIAVEAVTAGKFVVFLRYVLSA